MSNAYAGETVPACTGVKPATKCAPQEMGVSPPVHRCGSMIACELGRDLAITAKVETTYTPGPADYRPPAPPHDLGADPIAPMGTWNHALATAWFPRPEGTGTVNDIDSVSCGTTNRDLMIMAIPTPQFGQRANAGPDDWNLAYWCGACAEVVGPTGKRVRVQIATQRGMDPGSTNYYSIDLPGNLYPDPRVDTPYSLIDDNSQCTVNGATGLSVDYRIVPCEVCGGVVLRYMPEFNSYIPAFRFHNHRLPIVDAYIQTASGTWQRMQRDSVNSYKPVNPPNPMRLRIVAIDGAVIEGAFPGYSAGKSYETTSQF